MQHSQDVLWIIESVKDFHRLVYPRNVHDTLSYYLNVHWCIRNEKKKISKESKVPINLKGDFEKGQPEYLYFIQFSLPLYELLFYTYTVVQYLSCEQPCLEDLAIVLHVRVHGKFFFHHPARKFREEFRIHVGDGHRFVQTFVLLRLQRLDGDVHLEDINGIVERKGIAYTKWSQKIVLSRHFCDTVPPFQIQHAFPRLPVLKISKHKGTVWINERRLFFVYVPRFAQVFVALGEVIPAPVREKRKKLNENLRTFFTSMEDRGVNLKWTCTFGDLEWLHGLLRNTQSDCNCNKIDWFLEATVGRNLQPFLSRTQQ